MLNHVALLCDDAIALENRIRNENISVCWNTEPTIITNA